MEFINIFEDSHPLYELCKKEEWTDCETYEEWYNRSGELDVFEGDPDMIKINGSVGYFFRHGDTVFYLFESFYGDAEKMLRKFFNSYTLGTTVGGESICYGKNPWGVTDIIEDHWQRWDKMQTGIAYRGGAGYSYYVSDWTKYYNRYIN